MLGPAVSDAGESERGLNGILCSHIWGCHVNRLNALEDFLYGWVRRHAPHVSRDVLDSLVDNVSDFWQEEFAPVSQPSNPADSPDHWNEQYRKLVDRI